MAKTKSPLNNAWKVGMLVKHVTLITSRGLLESTIILENEPDH